MAGNHLKRCALMHWSFFLLDDDTKCLVWWVNYRNTDAKKARPKIMCFLRKAGNNLKRRVLMRWSFSILNDDTKCLVWWVNNRNTEARKIIFSVAYIMKRHRKSVPNAPKWHPKIIKNPRKCDPGRTRAVLMASRIASGQGVGISYVWGKLGPTARDTIWVDREPLLETVFGTKTKNNYPKRH